MAIEAGAAVPDATLKQMTPSGIKDIELEPLSNGKKVILFGLLGAFTPVCFTQHLPGFVAEADELKAGGVTAIACISVNDPFVMSAWGKEHGVGDRVMMLCDPDARFVKSLGLSLGLSGLGLGNRSKRWSMVVEDGVVATVNVEDSIFDAHASGAKNLAASVSAPLSVLV